MTVGDVVTEGAARFPDYIALRQDGASVTYGALNGRVNRLAQALVKRGLSKGDRAGALLHNCYQSVEILFAVAKTGAIFCPYPVSLTERQALDLMRTTRPKFLFFSDSVPWAARGVRPAVSSVEHLFFLGTVRSPIVESYEALLSEGIEREPLSEVTGDDPACIFFGEGPGDGSGETVRRHHELTTRHDMPGESGGPGEERMLLSLPLHDAAFADNLLRCMVVGGRTVLAETGLQGADLLQLIVREKITTALLSAGSAEALGKALAARGDGTRTDLEDICSGRAAPGTLAGQLHDLFGAGITRDDASDGGRGALPGGVRGHSIPQE